MSLANPSCVSIILARAINGVIGRDGTLPWHIPADLKRFKRLTMGGTLVMGRRTFESLPGLLSGRRHLVMSRRPYWQAKGAELAHSPEEALAMAGQEPVWVIGGAEVFRHFLPRAQRIELTEVLDRVTGETAIEDPRASAELQEMAREHHPGSATHPAFRFVTLQRIESPTRSSAWT